MKISAVIIAGNEETKIAKAIKSVLWADEVIVVDSESTDLTREIAESLGCRVLIRKWTGFADQKQFGVDSARNDWILSLDADEMVSECLHREIVSLFADPNARIGGAYRIARLSSYMGRPIRHSGWYPDWQLRLFDRRKARWNDAIIHESVYVLDGGKVEKIKGEILHYSVDNAAQHHLMIGTRYAPLAARQMFEKGRRTTLLGVMFAGPAAFLSTFILKAGFLDGFPGFCIARFAAQHAFLKRLILFELQSDDPNIST